ncbi:retron St85 family RNA-directed DNA polymerase [Desulfosediminicola sp.]|uniref:retron St85 family RNA-directed DNA polymerase n=1 Tax=Desulfosediminicola sp. TaxID=2886825 RepID=UPI003AF20C15
MTTANHETLRLLNLPIFKDVDSLSEVINIDTGRLNTLIENPYKFYKRYEIKKKSGDSRLIMQPNKEMKAIQAWILRNILDKLSPSYHATAFNQGVGLIDNVIPHKYNRYFLCVDIEDFFPSIKTFRVKRIFSVAGFSKNASSILARLCTCKNGLPQGGVTSPSLSNLVCAHLDKRISGLVAKRNIIYTRYADDFTFSSNNPAKLHLTYPIIKKIIEDEGFLLNDSKTRYMGPKAGCHVTGLVKNSSAPGFSIGKKKKIQMRAIMHNLVAKKKITSKYSSVESIDGWLAYLKSVDESSHLGMKKYWDQLKAK